MPICITFAGPVGSSKTPIATYLSWNLGLPIFNNDAIRSEVSEDLGKFDVEVYTQRRQERGVTLINSGISFIKDSSVDRAWPFAKPKLLEKGYRCFIISLDLSKELMEKLHKAKGYNESLERLDSMMADHENFLSQFKDDVGFSITDDNFGQRLELCLGAVREWMKTFKA
ncbi:MAG: hypothetical protein WC750_01540 [Patescibacteria group bacterium]|jgi:hypothetical protein